MTPKRKNAWPAAAVFKELQGIIHHPRADEIFLNGWLHDGGLPIPSPELSQYLAFRLLHGHGVKIFAGINSREEITAAILEALRSESIEESRASVQSVGETLACYRFLDSGKEGSESKFAHEWRAVLYPFLFPDKGADSHDAAAYAAGERALAQGLIESMVLRAVFSRDPGRIEGLAEVIRQSRDNIKIRPTHINRIAGEIMRWLPWLTQGLDHTPTKTEIKEFLMQVFPAALRDKPADWAIAYSLVGFSDRDERKRKINMDQILKLANLARAEELP